VRVVFVGGPRGTSGGGVPHQTTYLYFYLFFALVLLFVLIYLFI